MKTELSPKVGILLTVVLVAIVGAVAMYFYKKSDPAAQGPLPYVPFNRAAHNDEMTPKMPGNAGPDGKVKSGASNQTPPQSASGQ